MFWWQCIHDGQFQKFCTFLEHTSLDIIHSSWVNNTTCIHIVCISGQTKGHQQILQALLEYDIDCDQPDTKGSTALEFAASRDHIEMLKILLKAGAKSTMRVKARAKPICYRQLIMNQRWIHWRGNAVLNRRNRERYYASLVWYTLKISCEKHCLVDFL